MYWIFMSLAAIVILFVLLGMGKGGFKVRKRQILCLLGAVFVVGGMYTTVPTGHTGILTTFGRVENTTLEAGLHMKSPFQEVIAMDNRTQKQTLELLCFSSNIQEVSISYSINYQIQKANAQTIYKTIGKDYYHVVMEPRIQDAVKSVMAKYTAESLIEHREKLSASITEILVQELSVYNNEVINTAIENMDFSDAFTQAVEEKQVAQQQLLKAQTEQAQRTMEQEAEANRNVIKAEADAKTAVIAAEAEIEITKIQADAAEYAGKKDAAVNEAIAASLTPELLYYYYITNWNGELPTTFISQDDFMSMFQINPQVAGDSQK